MADGGLAQKLFEFWSESAGTVRDGGSWVVDWGAVATGFQLRHPIFAWIEEPHEIMRYLRIIAASCNEPAESALYAVAEDE